MEHRQIVTCAFNTQLFALVQVALREPLDLHWLHKVEFQSSKASSAEVLWCLMFAFPLNTGAVGLWHVIHYFRGHGHQHQVAKRMADCSSLATGRLSLGLGVFDTYPLVFP